MNNKPNKMVWDSCLDETPTSCPVKIKSLTNNKYKENLEVVKKIIANNNTRFLEERKKVSSLIIKDSSIENGYEDVLNYIQKSNLPDNVSELVLKTVLRTSMQRIPDKDLYSKEIYLSSIKRAKSIKLHNIILNIPKCIELLIESYGDPISNEKSLLYVFMILIFVKKVINLCTVDLSEFEAILISCIYSYGGSSSLEQIYSRLNTSNLLEKYQISQSKDLLAHLNKLLDLKIVSKDNDVYNLVEEVFI